MPGEEARKLARVAAVTSDLDRILDKLFANVAEIKVILGQAEPDPPGTKQEDQ